MVLECVRSLTDVRVKYFCFVVQEFEYIHYFCSVDLFFILEVLQRKIQIVNKKTRPGMIHYSIITDILITVCITRNYVPKDKMSDFS